MTIRKTNLRKSILNINVNVETYAGGELGTTFNNSASAYEDPTPATENAGMTDKFKYGEYFFERSYTQNSKLSMVWDRFISAIHV